MIAAGHLSGSAAAHSHRPRLNRHDLHSKSQSAEADSQHDLATKVRNRHVKLTSAMASKKCGLILTGSNRFAARVRWTPPEESDDQSR